MLPADEDETATEVLQPTLPPPHTDLVAAVSDHRDTGLAALHFWESGLWWWSLAVLGLSQFTSISVDGVADTLDAFMLVAHLLDVVLFASPGLIVGLAVRSVVLSRRSRNGQTVKRIATGQRVGGAAALLGLLLIAPFGYALFGGGNEGFEVAPLEEDAIGWSAAETAMCEGLFIGDGSTEATLEDHLQVTLNAYALLRAEGKHDLADVVSNFHMALADVQLFQARGDWAGAERAWSAVALYGADLWTACGFDAPAG